MSLENFSTWNEVDPDNEIRVMSNKIFWEELDRNNICELYKDFGTNYFDNFEHKFDIQISKIMNMSNRIRLIIIFWQIRNNDNDSITAYAQQIRNSNDKWQLVFHQQKNKGNVHPVYTGRYQFEVNKTYYLTISKNNTLCRIRVYTDPERRNILLDSQNLNWVNDKYQYLSVTKGINPGVDPADWSSGYLENLILSPMEEYTDLPASLYVKKEEAYGLSTHLTPDTWTLDDTLGYNAYAYAIYRFLIHPETKPPLTISVQAPWGGGKTSLMRMIQNLLDPTILKSYKEQHKIYENDNKTRKKSKFTLKNVRDEIKRYKKGKHSEFNISDNLVKKHLLTIWFNAWKYEDTEQIWAGLADAIVRQFAERLGPIQCEKFLFHLHLKRLDFNTIRHKIYSRIITVWWRHFYPWFIGSMIFLISIGIVSIFGWISRELVIRSVRVDGILLFIVGIYQTIAQYSNVINEPAEISLGEYVRVPNYSSRLGFVHYVEEDLQRVFNIIPEDYGPLVIFIDDLDRCAPENVANVVEAVYLFLAGEFKSCIFVLGIDPEMVAAALEEAHSKVIAKLPADAKKIPIGWRFMDKFVQLPFVIPPPEKHDLENFTRSLLSDQREEMQSLDQVIETSEIETTEENLRYQFEQIRERIDRGIESFSDQDSEIKEIILKAASEFSNNPRELKRFFNLFRFLYFLKWVRERPENPAPTLDQLRRWIILSMKWLQVICWTRRENDVVKSETQIDTETSTTAYRLKQLEEIGKSNDFQDWLCKAKEQLQLDFKETSWINDRELMIFFKREGNLNENERLSSAAGKGLW